MRVPEPNTANTVRPSTGPEAVASVVTWFRVPGPGVQEFQGSGQNRRKGRSGAAEAAAARATVAEPYLFEVLQVSEIFETFETENEGCEELLELLGLVELVELLGLVLEAADDALCVPVTRTCWLTCLLRSSLDPVSW